MKINKGTKKAEALFAQLRAEGDLVDVYSKEFFDRQPSIKDKKDALFTQEDYQYILDEFENNPEAELKPMGHLLFIHIDDSKPEIRKELVALYPPLQALIDSVKHNPDFLILNLYTKQMLCVGLGRKNRIFCIDAATNKGVNAFDLLSGLHAAGIFGVHLDDDFMVRFTQHDTHDAISDFLHAIKNLGVSFFEYDSEPATLDDVELSLDESPDSQGMYKLIDCTGREIDDNTYTKEELVFMLQDLERIQSIEVQSMKTINVFFPQCESYEFNTGNY